MNPTSVALINRGLVTIQVGLAVESGAAFSIHPDVVCLRNFTGQEAALREIKECLSESSRFLLAHHITNCLTSVVSHCQLGDTEKAERAAFQLADMILELCGKDRVGKCMEDLYGNRGGGAPQGDGAVR